MRREVTSAANGFGNGGSRKRGLQKTLEAAIEVELEALMGRHGPLDLAGLELQARRVALQVTGQLLQIHLNADVSDGTQPVRSCPACGGLARLAGRREKCFESVLGPLRLRRAYYHCAACGSGFYPRDCDLGVEGVSLTPALTRMVGHVGALVSFAEGSELLHELSGVLVDAKQVERTAERLGQEILADERRVVSPATPIADTLYLGMDGTGVPVRPAERLGRAGKQPDGTARTREVKLVTVWSAEGRDAQGIPERDRGSISYSAAIESAASRDTDAALSAFAQRVSREAARRGFDRASRRVVLGDGAPWIWKLAEELFPGAIQIVDLFHAKGHLWDVAKSIYRPGSEIGEQWAKQRRDELDRGDIDAILAALEAHAAHDEEARKCLGYIHTNRQRLQYPAFRAQGLCVSTGVVEAGCKVAIGTRLKRAGMRWTVAGADAIIALRCCRLSGRFDDFWARRTNRVAGKL